MPKKSLDEVLREAVWCDQVFGRPPDNIPDILATMTEVTGYKIEVSGKEPWKAVVKIEPRSAVEAARREFERLLPMYLIAEVE